MMMMIIVIIFIVIIVVVAAVDRQPVITHLYLVVVIAHEVDLE